MFWIIFFAALFYIYHKLKPEYFMEYRAEFITVPSMSKKMVWALRRRNGLFQSETIQIDNDKKIIESVLIKELTSSYDLDTNRGCLLYTSPSPRD